MWYYSNYQRDIDDQNYRRAHKSSATVKLLVIIVWFALIVVFA